MLSATLNHTLRVEDLIGKRAMAFLKRHYPNQLHPIGISYFAYVFGLANLLKQLGADSAVISAAMLYPLAINPGLRQSDMAEVFDNEVIELVEELRHPGISDLPIWSTDLRYNENFKRNDTLEKMFLLTLVDYRFADQSTDVYQTEHFQNREVQIENLLRLLMAATTDVRTLVITLAERLHFVAQYNTRPVSSLQEKAITNSRLNMALYAPLASRLGLWQLKSKLEDSAFQFLFPERFKEIETNLAHQRERNDQFIGEIIHLVKDKIRKSGINAINISGREKSIFSIYQKMQTRHLTFEQLNDLLGIRILVNTRQDCYALMGLLHTLWKPLITCYDGDTCRDWIRTPKENGYQSLHTTVLIQDKTAEVQIRTEQMHELAEYGVYAAHWRYKEGKQSDEIKKKDLAWNKQLEKLRKILTDVPGPLSSLQKGLLQKRIYVITRDGHVIDLPAHATILDSAYRIHTDLGDRCIGAKVDGRFQNIDYHLHNGEIVEILTLEHPQAAYRLGRRKPISFH
jgi:GTP diphosphokinase / guanosine-3',5'-bis(diphosphate) 3'-diphosphatase